MHSLHTVESVCSAPKASCCVHPLLCPDATFSEEIISSSLAACPDSTHFIYQLFYEDCPASTTQSGLPSSAPESLAGVFPCVHSHLHMHSISRTHRILGPSHLVSLPQSSILALHHRPWHGDPVLHGPHPQCYAWSSISSSVSQNLETILPLLWRPHPLPLQHVFHLSSYLPQAMKLPQEKKQKLSRIWLG